MKKKLTYLTHVSAFGAAAVLAAVLLACGGQAKESVHLIIKTAPYPVTNGEDSEEITEAYSLLEKAAEEFSAQYQDRNVTFDVVKFDYVDEEKYVTDCFDTEDAADILFEGFFNMSSYIYTGRVVPLDDVVEGELETDFSETDLNLGRADGKLYMLPHHSLQNTMVYNKDIFRECGLEEYIADAGTITAWTIDEWNTILDTLAEKMPEMTYPMMMYAKNNQGDTHIMTLLRSYGCTFFDEDGLLCLDTPEGIEALTWIAEGNQKGYFPEGAQNLELADCMTLFADGQLAICMQNNSTVPGLDAEKYGLVNFPGNGDTGYSTSFVVGFSVFDNGDSAKVETAKDFLRYLYSQEELMDYEAAGIPANLSVADRMADSIYMLDAYSENRSTSVDFTGNNPNWQGTDTSVRSVFWPHINALLTGTETPGECAAGIDADCNAAILEGRENGTLHE